MQVLATYQANMTKLVVVGGGGGSTVGIAGSVDVNNIASNVQALDLKQVQRGGQQRRDGDRETGTDLSPIVGSVAIGGTFGGGGSVLLDEFSDNTQAFISGNSQVIGQGNAPVTVPLADGSNNTESTSGVAVIATTNNLVTEVNVNGGGALTAAVAATVCIDLIDDTTQAYIDGSTVNPSFATDNAAQAVFVRAANHTYADVTAGAVAARHSRRGGDQRHHPDRQ